MPLTGDVIRRAIIVSHAHDACFVELVGMAELDRTTAFRGASMRGTDLREQDLTGFDFTGADFDGADVRGADFSGTAGLTIEMFRNARLDHTTIWPQHMQARMGHGLKNRLQLDLSQATKDDLDALMRVSGVTTRAELIRNALSLMKWAIKEAEKGNRIASMDEEGKVTEIRMPILDAAVQKPNSG